jgi:hypothetical protein
MAAAATQQFSLVVQLGINFATVVLELYGRMQASTAATAEGDGVPTAEQRNASESRGGAAAETDLREVMAEPMADDRGSPAGTGVAGHGVTGVQRLAIRLYFVCSGFGTRMMWYSLNVALPYFTQLYGPEVYPRMLLGYNLGAIVSLFAQVVGDARFDALYGPIVTTCFRVNLGLGCMFLLMLYFPHTENHPSVPVALSAAVGVLDYFATGSLTQMASRVGGIVPTFFFLGQALSGAFLFGFTSSVDWSVEEMAVDNVQHYTHSHHDVLMFFGYASSFVFIGQVAFNFLITSDVIKEVHGVHAEQPWHYHVRGDSQARQPLLVDTVGAGADDSTRHDSCAQLRQSILAFRLTWPLQVGIVVLWVSLLSVQALFGLDKTLQEPLMFVNLFGLMTGMQLNVLFAKKLDVIASPTALLGTVCTIMPAFATVYTLQTLGVATLLNGDYLRVGATAFFYVLGGSTWMLCYTVCNKVLHSDELRTEATRLLNLLTQAGILAGVGIGMLLVDVSRNQGEGSQTSAG